ncbi:MAG: HAMP domain-containing histidine kinase [Cyclobacteriaceae bacterium]|nr:HAMP domain-containing histidine kinase [Cyclobacteriaceae bacterium]
MTEALNSPAANKDFLEQILDFLPYPFVIAESNGDTYRNSHLNKKFLEEIGYSLDEIPTMEAWFQYAYPNEQYRQEVTNGWALKLSSAQESGQDAITMRVLIQTKNNGKRWYEVKASVIDGLQVVAFINIHDEVLRQQELKHLNDNKNQVLSVLTHDLRSPIQNLQAIMKLAFRDDLTQAEFFQLIRDLHERSRSILDLLDTTLLWAKSNFNSIQLKRAPVDVRHIAKQITEAYDNFTKIKQLHITLNISDDKPISDPDVINIVLRNLLSNAIKFTPMGGKIEVRGAMNNGVYELVVFDSGVGMDENVVSKVLNEAGISSRGTLNEHGIGIGLSLCLQLLSRIKGELSIESEPGKGTVVRICF